VREKFQGNQKSNQKGAKKGACLLKGINQKLHPSFRRGKVGLKESWKKKPVS